MAVKRLTEEGVKKLKPSPGKQVLYFDSGLQGLVLTVSGGGTKSWSAVHYVGGKPRYYGLGRFPYLDLKTARDKAKDFLRDPQQAVREANAKTFGAVADEYLKRHAEKTGLRTLYEIKRCLDKYIRPRWGERLLTELRKTDVIDMLDDIADDHGPRQAGAVRTIVYAVMNFYADRDDDYITPRVKPQSKSIKRSRFLDETELRALWEACDEVPAFGPLVKVLLLTGQRRAKVANMKWADIKDGEWTIPTEEREKGNPGILKLPDMARAIIDAQPRIAGNPYVFAGRNGAAFNSWSQRKDELDTKMPGMKKPWVIHDLRRTARTLMSRAGVSSDIAERVLGHTIGGVEDIYDRYAYLDEKAQALNALATLIDRIIDPPANNVVALHR